MSELDLFCISMVVDTLNELDVNERENYDVDILVELVKKSIELWEGKNE